MATLKLTVDVAVPGMEGLTKVTSELEGIEAASSKTGSTMTGIFQGIGQSIASFGIGLVTSGISAAVDQIGNSITLASDKAEAASKVNVLFGESADVVTRASEDAATSVGLSSGAYLAAAGDLGNLTTNLGFTADEAANMSVEMLTLAADMGSFNNASTEEVTAAMGAAFRGETEPIRRFGVMLSDAAVKAKAVELGLYSGVGALDANAKATATYQLILEQTTAAQGDFERTSDGLANTQKISAARMEDAWTRVGEVLAPIAAEILPLIADAIVGLVGFIMDIVDAIREWVDDNQELMGQLGALADILIDGLAWAFGLVMDIVGELGYRLGAFIGIIIDVLGAIVDFGDAVIRALSGDFEGAAQAAERGLDRIGSFAENVQRVMGDTARRAADEQAMAAAATAEAWDEATAQGLKSSAEVEENFARQAAAGGANIASSAAEGTEAGLRAGTPGVEDAAGDMGATIPEAVHMSAEEAHRIARAIPGEMADGLRSGRDSVSSAMDQLKDDIKNAIDPAKEIAQLEGMLTGKALTKGLQSTDPIVRAQAQATQNIIEDRITQLQGPAHGWGENIGSAWSAGIAAGIRANLDKLHAAMKPYDQAMHGQSPPPKGPLKDIDKWGENIGRAWALGIAEGAADFALGAPIGPLGLSATPGAWPRAGAMASPGATYQITIQAGVGDPVAIGREVVEMIGHYERSNGREWRS